MQRRKLKFASRQFRSSQINGSFYWLQQPQSYSSWYEQTPAGFQFSVKAPVDARRLEQMLDRRCAAAKCAATFAVNVTGCRYGA